MEEVQFPKFKCQIKLQSTNINYLLFWPVSIYLHVELCHSFLRVLRVPGEKAIYDEIILIFSTFL
jgi:hypothetical protein